MRIQAAPADVRIARIAARQHGAVSTGQLAVAGVDSAAIARRLRSGRLHRVHRGVYAVGHPSLARGGRRMAAVLACGHKAVLSHRSAAQLWGLLPPGPGPIDVTIPVSGGRLRLRGVRRHRSRSLTPDDVGRRLGIPVTALERTISDLRRIASAAETRRAIRQAAVIGFEIPQDVERDRMRSKLEREFLSFCRRQRLPPPEVNVAIGSFTVDFLWRDRGLIVEADGYRYHRGRQAFEEDRSREWSCGRSGSRSFGSPIAS